MNETIRLLLNHRSIRGFPNENIAQEKIDLFIQAAQHAPTNSFLQQYSIIDITDEMKKKTLAESVIKPTLLKQTGCLSSQLICIGTQKLLRKKENPLKF
ncbi:nitroreductase family protein [Sporolactobacillus pectinivorans]|uniref:nitroreductase family protein n=1 Tax=Sporolactobacillus pectinivorans TaxID=1591408 RepID=UPI001961A96E|nr:nitroreductase family protein [Sporolactobacillus pectinivorans]